MNRRISLLTLCFIVAAASFPLVAATPPAIGGKAPDFALRTVQGRTVRLSEAALKSPVVLIVLRGYPGYQCPFCNRQVRDFAEKAQEFNRLGAKVIMVYPGPSRDLGSRAREFLSGAGHRWGSGSL